ncbi:MAG TPA: lysine--tRNA ligase [Chitinophagaceae bacterium]|nr:lysine--tRNA ligase [Chitinophagaceae bacterium]
MSEKFSEQQIIRREKLKQLLDLGIDPYPAPSFPVNAHAADIKSRFTQENKDQFTDQVLAGRIMGIRDMGKACFAVLQDSTGRIQLYVRREDLCPGEDKTLFDVVFKKLLDIGDLIGVRGFVFTTRTGEISVHVQEFTLLSKSLHPLPVVKEKEGETFDAVTDPEFLYRQRYAGLIVDPSIRKVFTAITRMKDAIREFLNGRGALEVDTPVLQAIPGGAAARPFITHHNALDMPLYLRIANELYLKRLIVGGFDWVYEFSRNFRNEGMDRTHNPEFTILEFYVAYKDYLWMMETTEQMLQFVAHSVNGSSQVFSGTSTIDFKAPYPRIPIYEALAKYAGHDISNLDEGGIREACRQNHVPVQKDWGKGKLTDALFSHTCEPHFIQPTFITDYPEEMSPLTKKHRSKPGLVERFELIVNGNEIANAYSELNDPLDQRSRFEAQASLKEKGDEEAMYIDHDFLRALEYGMPPASGIGIGIDRLAMLLTGQPSIQDVLLFPQMRPEQ